MSGRERRRYPMRRKAAASLRINPQALRPLFQQHGQLRVAECAAHLGVRESSTGLPLLRLYRAGVLTRRYETPAERDARWDARGPMLRTADGRKRSRKPALLYAWAAERAA